MSCNCPKCSYNNPPEPQRATKDAVVVKDDLSNLYCGLTWKMQDVLVTVKDSNCISNRNYGELLEPGTVVKVNDHYYFYSCPFGMMNLEGAWTSEESVSYSTCAMWLMKRLLSSLCTWWGGHREAPS